MIDGSGVPRRTSAEGCEIRQELKPFSIQTYIYIYISTPSLIFSGIEIVRYFLAPRFLRLGRRMWDKRQSLRASGNQVKAMLMPKFGWRKVIPWIWGIPQPSLTKKFRFPKKQKGSGVLELVKRMKIWWMKPPDIHGGNYFLTYLNVILNFAEKPLILQNLFTKGRNPHTKKVKVKWKTKKVVRRELSRTSLIMFDNLIQHFLRKTYFSKSFTLIGTSYQFCFHCHCRIPSPYACQWISRLQQLQQPSDWWTSRTALSTMTFDRPGNFVIESNSNSILNPSYA